MLRNLRIRAAHQDDVREILEVLDQCELPVDRLNPLAALSRVALLGEKIVACAWGEQFDHTFFIESVGVLKDYREQQIATHLVRALLMLARANACTACVLLTAEHPGFFARYGFLIAPMSALPKQLSLPKEFQRRFGALTHCMFCRLD